MNPRGGWEARGRSDEPGVLPRSLPIGSFTQNTLSLLLDGQSRCFKIRQRPIRTLVSVAGVALGVCLVMFFTGLARGMSEDLQRRAGNVRAEILFTRPGGMQLTGSTANLSTNYVELLKEVDGVEEAMPVVVDVLQGNRGFGFERIEGVEWGDYAPINN